ncbi:hypothetical protein D9M68_776720 [compost metagenome]
MIKQGLLGSASQVGDDHRSGKCRDDFEAVELGIIGAPAKPFEAGEKGARIMIVPRAEAAADGLGRDGGQVGQEQRDQYTPVSKGHGNSRAKERALQLVPGT